MDSQIYFILFASGLVGGVLAGLFGIGGGLIYTFIIPWFLQLIPGVELSADFIIANSFVGVLFASLSSGIKIAKDKEMPYKQVFVGGFFAVVSSWLAHLFIVSQEWYSMKYFRGVIVCLILVIIARLFLKQKEQIKREEKPTDMPITGLFGGFIAALSGFGGGVIMVPMLLLMGSFEMKKAKNISLGIIVLISSVIVFKALFPFEVRTLGELTFVGSIIPELVIPMLLGTIIGGPIGVIIAKRISSQILMISYLSLLAVLMVYYLYKIFQ